MLSLLITLLACDDSNDYSSEEVEDIAAVSSESASGGADVVVENPIVSTQFFGQNGNLWKPAGDDHGAGAGNLVVLLSAEFTEEFDSCEVVHASGEVRQLICINDQPWTHTPFSCFSNGDRQTWRADFKCSEAAEVKVTCREEKQEIVFTVPDQVKHQVCSRFG